MFSRVENVVHKIPIVSGIIEAMYSYFRKNILYSNLIHVVLGIGLGLYLGVKYLLPATILIVIGSLGHLYAFVQGRKL